MNTKITLPRLAAILAQRSGKSKKLAEDFIKAFFATIAESLQAGESVRVKGLGLFKLVRVEERKSVNVATGASTVIPAHDKLTFLPAKELAEAVNAPFSIFDTVELSDGYDPEETPDDAPKGRPLRIAEERPDEMISSGESPVEGSPSGESPIEESSAVEGTAEESSAEESSAEENPIEESPAEGGVAAFVDDTEKETLEGIEGIEDVSDSNISGTEVPDSDSSVSPIAEPLDEEESQTDNSISPAPLPDPQPQPSSSTHPPYYYLEPEPQEDSSESSSSILRPESLRSRRSFGKGFLIGFGCALLLALAGCGLGWYFLLRDAQTAVTVAQTRPQSNPQGAADPDAMVPTAPSDSQIAKESDKSEASEEVESYGNREAEATPASNNQQDAEKKSSQKKEPVYDKVTSSRYLTTIAREHYGNVQFWPYIYEENRAILGHPDRIRPGTKIVVPDLSKYGVDPHNKVDEQKARRKGTEIYARYRR